MTLFTICYVVVTAVTEVISPKVKMVETASVNTCESRYLDASASREDIDDAVDIVLDEAKETYGASEIDLYSVATSKRVYF